MYYQALKKKIVSFIKMYMDFQDIILSEITQRKIKTARSHSHLESKKKKKKTLMERDMKSVFVRDGEGGGIIG